MGDMSDMIDTTESFDDFTHWLTKDGILLAVKDMDTIHIRNTMNMIEKDIARIKETRVVYDEIETEQQLAYLKGYLMSFSKELLRR